MRDVADLSDVDGIAVEPESLEVVVEELAHAIVADQEGEPSTPGRARVVRPPLWSASGDGPGCRPSVGLVMILADDA